LCQNADERLKLETSRRPHFKQSIETISLLADRLY
jgi:hypothetical protein